MSVSRGEKVWKSLSIAHRQRLQPSKIAVNEGDADMIGQPPSFSAEALESALHVELPLNSSQLVWFFFPFFPAEALSRELSTFQMKVSLRDI